MEHRPFSPGKVFLRSAAWCVLISFITTTLLPQQLLAQPIHAGPLSAGDNQGFLAGQFHLDVPRELGELSDYFMPLKSESPSFVFHIQDAHSNPSAQRKIRDLLSFLEGIRADRNMPLVIGMEGAKGEIHAEFLDFFPEYPEVNECLIHAMVEKGELTGAELFAWDIYKNHHKVSEISVVGVEEAELYRDNLKAFRELLFAQTEIETLLDGVRKKINLAGSKIFSPEIARFLKERERRKYGRFGDAAVPVDEVVNPQFEVYIQFLISEAKRALEVDLNHPFEQLRFPHLVRLHALFDLEHEKGLTAGAVERDQIAQSLSSSPESIRGAQIIETLTRLEEQSDPRTVLEDLWAFASEHHIKIDHYRGFWKWAASLVLKSEMNAVEVFAEIEKIESSLMMKLAKSDTEKQLLDIIEKTALFEKLLKAQLTREEYLKLLEQKSSVEDAILGDLLDAILNFAGKYTPTAKKISQENEERRLLAGHFEAALRFYEGAKKRDEALVQNTLNAASGQSASVLITGGFHTEGVTQWMKTQGVGYAVVRPNIEYTDSGDLYHRVIKNENADLSAYFDKDLFTKQEAVYLKMLLEVAVPALWEKYQIPHNKISKIVADGINRHPVLRSRINAEADESMSQSTIRLTLHSRTTDFEKSPSDREQTADALGAALNTQLPEFMIYLNGEDVPAGTPGELVIDVRPAGVEVAVRQAPEKNDKRSEMRVEFREQPAAVIRYTPDSLKKLLSMLAAVPADDFEQHTAIPQSIDPELSPVIDKLFSGYPEAVKNQLRHFFSIAVENAIDSYLQLAERTELGSGKEFAEDLKIEFYKTIDGQEVVIRMAANGVPLKDGETTNEKREKRFKRLGGHGLGAPEMNELAEKMGGSWRLLDRRSLLVDQDGSIVEVRFPAAAGEAITANEGEKASRSESREKERIATEDDDFDQVADPRSILGDIVAAIEREFDVGRQEAIDLIPSSVRSESRREDDVVLNEQAVKDVEIITDYLAERSADIPQNPDLLVVMGNPDYEKNGTFAARIYHELKPKHVLVTGKGKLEKPESHFLRDVMVQNGVPADLILIEDESMNTGQNAAFSAKLIKDKGISVKSAVLTQFPFGMRLSRRIFQKQFLLDSPVVFYSYAPDALTVSQNASSDEISKFLELLDSQMGRFVSFEDQGFIDHVENDPSPQITAAYGRLKEIISELKGRSEARDDSEFEKMIHEETGIPEVSDEVVREVVNGLRTFKSKVARFLEEFFVTQTRREDDEYRRLAEVYMSHLDIVVKGNGFNIFSVVPEDGSWHPVHVVDAAINSEYARYVPDSLVRTIERFKVGVVIRNGMSVINSGEFDDDLRYLIQNYTHIVAAFNLKELEFIRRRGAIERLLHLPLKLSRVEAMFGSDGKLDYIVMVPNNLIENSGIQDVENVISNSDIQKYRKQVTHRIYAFKELGLEEYGIEEEKRRDVIVQLARGRSQSARAALSVILESYPRIPEDKRELLQKLFDQLQDEGDKKIIFALEKINIPGDAAGETGKIVTAIEQGSYHYAVKLIGELKKAIDDEAVRRELTVIEDHLLTGKQRNLIHRLSVLPIPADAKLNMRKLLVEEAYTRVDTQMQEIARKMPKDAVAERTAIDQFRDILNRSESRDPLDAVESEDAALLSTDDAFSAASQDFRRLDDDRRLQASSIEISARVGLLPVPETLRITNRIDLETAVRLILAEIIGDAFEINENRERIVKVVSDELKGAVPFNINAKGPIHILAVAKSEEVNAVLSDHLYAIAALLIARPEDKHTIYVSAKDIESLGPLLIDAREEFRGMLEKLVGTSRYADRLQLKPVRAGDLNELRRQAAKDISEAAIEGLETMVISDDLLLLEILGAVKGMFRYVRTKLNNRDAMVLTATLLRDPLPEDRTEIMTIEKRLEELGVNEQSSAQIANMIKAMKRLAIAA